MIGKRSHNTGYVVGDTIPPNRKRKIVLTRRIANHHYDLKNGNVTFVIHSKSDIAPSSFVCLFHPEITMKSHRWQLVANEEDTMITN